MAKWQLKGCAKNQLEDFFNLNTYAFEAQQNVSMSVVGTVVIVDFKTLKPFYFQFSIVLDVYSSFVRSTNVSFIKNGVKEGKTSLMSFLTVRLNSSVSMAGTEVTVVFKTLKPPSFQLSIVQHISSSLVRSPKVYFD